MTSPAAFIEDDAVGKVYDRRLAARLFAYVRPYRGLVAGAVALLIVDGLLQLVGPWLTKVVIDDAIPTGDMSLVTQAALVFLVSLGVQFGAQYGETVLTALLGQKVMHDLRRQLFAHLQRLPVPFFDRNPVGRLVTRVTSDVESLNELFTAGVVAGLGDLFTLAAIGITMLVVDWRLALAAFIVIPFVYLVSHVFRSRVRVHYREIRTRLARINAFLQERLTGMSVVQLFGREESEARRFDTLNRDHLDAHLRSIRVYALYFPVIEVLTSVALASLIMAGSGWVENSTLTIGTLAAFLQLVRRFFQPLQDLSDKFNTLQQAMASSERIFRLLDTPTEQDAQMPGGNTANAEAIAAQTTLDGASGDGIAKQPSDGVTSMARTNRQGVTVTFESVWFHYGESPADGSEPAWVLKDVSFEVTPGETLALVGHTGAGKTTVISLLMRYYDPQKGRILLDGVDVRNIPRDVLRSHIGFVQQDIFLFAGDVASNIRLSAPLSDEEVRMAAARVGADRVIEKLPGGYSYQLGERGTSLSVGERQLLSFARAIASEPALLLLDEATSAVDSELEAQIQLAIGELMTGRTTIAVAHRLSTIVRANQILVMHHGRVTESGTHLELLARGGLYERLYQLQVGELASGVASGS